MNTLEIIELAASLETSVEIIENINEHLGETAQATQIVALWSAPSESEYNQILGAAFASTNKTVLHWGVETVEK